MKTRFHCLECRQPISQGVHEFSQELYGYPLCMKDQYLLEESGATAHTVDLYLALKARNFPVKLEYFDGYKHVDIAVPGKLYIEVSGQDLSERQILAGLSEDGYTLEMKIPTILIPNAMLDKKRTFSHVVNELSKACRVILNPVCGFTVACAPPLTAAQLQ
ncbi:MAG: hypothetical protein WDM78_06440 [Puia sp.]